METTPLTSALTEPPVNPNPDQLVGFPAPSSANFLVPPGPEVSTGNTKGSTMSTEAAAVVESTPVTPEVPAINVALNPLTVDASSFLATVDQIDTTTFKNPREELVETTIQDLCHAFKNTGQILPIACVRLANGKLAVYDGFTRTEAFNRNVYASLISKWNKEKELKSTDPNWLVVTNQLHRDMVRNAYPDEFEKEKNKPHNIVKVSTNTDVKTASDAFMRSVQANEMRNNFTPLERMNAIEKCIHEYGMKAQDVAKFMNRSPSNISQQRKARKLPDELKKLLVIPEAGEDIKEVELVKLREDIKILIEELYRRLNLSKGDTEGVDFAHVRMLSEKVVDVEALTLTRVQVLELLCDLVGADAKSRKLVKNKGCINLTLLKTKIATYESETKARREGKKPESTTTTISGDAAGAKTGTVEELVAKQEANKLSESLAEQEKKDTPVAVQPTTTATPVSTTTGTTTPAPKASDEAAESNADVALANMVGLDVAKLNALDDDDDDDDEAAITGEKKAKVQNAPLLGAKTKDANVILSAVQTMIAQVSEAGGEEQDKSYVLSAAYLMAASFGYEMVSLTEQERQLREVAIQFAEDLEAYLGLLEEHVKKANGLKHKRLGEFPLERPLIPTLSVSSGGAVSNTVEVEVSDTDDDLEDFDENFEEGLDADMEEDEASLVELEDMAEVGDEE